MSRVCCSLLLLSISLAGIQLFPATARAQIAGAAAPLYGAGVSWGVVSINALTEASGIAASRLNSGVLWTHNDGSGQNVYALSTNAERLATFNMNKSVDDTEDIAVGPGPASGVSYLYVGDIGGNKGTNTIRSTVKIVRMPEPFVDLAWASNPRSPDFAGVMTFTLAYPDGSYDAESLMVDPISGDVLIATKQDVGARLYRANLMSVPDKGSVTLEFVRAVAFNLASGGDISADGTQIVLRREDLAMSWDRSVNETVGDALGRTGQQIPVIGPPDEPNGEAIALMPDGTGYVTISEGKDPTLYFFESQDPTLPHFTLFVTNQSVLSGGSIQFQAWAVGYPSPVYRWYFGGNLITGASSPTLTLSNIAMAQSGQYEVIASNINGTASSSATLTIRPKPDLRITEVMSSETTSAGVNNADWWELTSFESQPVDLSGWRFNDNAGGLTDPFVIPDGIVIHAGESIVFVEGLTPAQFTTWWGNANLPSGLLIINYTGAGLSLGASGDGIRLWNANSADVASTMASVDFEAADTGVSFTYAPVTGVFGGKSQIGVNGALRSALASDIGSPGRIRAAATRPQLLSGLVNNKIRIEFDAVAGYLYSLQALTDLSAPTWELTDDTIYPSTNTHTWFEKTPSGNQQFYRIVVE